MNELPLQGTMARVAKLKTEHAWMPESGAEAQRPSVVGEIARFVFVTGTAMNAVEMGYSMRDTFVPERSGASWIPQCPSCDKSSILAVLIQRL